MQSWLGNALYGVTIVISDSTLAGVPSKLCKEVLLTPEFVSLDIVTQRDTTVLKGQLAPLLGASCSQDELKAFFLKKGATLDKQTDQNLYFLVTSSSKFLRTGYLGLPTSIVISFQNGAVDFVGASVAK